MIANPVSFPSFMETDPILHVPQRGLKVGSRGVPQLITMTRITSGGGVKLKIANPVSFPSFMETDPILHAPQRGLKVGSRGVPQLITMTRITSGSGVKLKSMEAILVANAAKSPSSTGWRHTTPVPLKIHTSFGVPRLATMIGTNHGATVLTRYKNTSHITCITEDSLDGTPWCSQTKDYDVDKKRIPCEASEGICIFPFIYKGKKYCACTRDGTVNRQLWCATTSNYDIDGKWRTCVLQEFGGNANGEACVIPFIYKEEIYYNCTNEDEPSGKLWCATTQSYDNDGKWTYCADAENASA
ncbi:UNVERIFIED_CONTAM: hypothetical protein K2H54_027161 [Gekko kuhli]